MLPASRALVATAAILMCSTQSEGRAQTCNTSAGRASYSMTYDAARRRTMVFGGVASDGRLSNDVMAWDGARWSCIVTGGPSARTDAALAWDAARNVLVLYGGRGSTGPLRDTWELSGTNWTQRDAAGPTPEPHPVAAYDDRAGGVLLFSGLDDDTPARFTWLWNGSKWSQVADAPSAQFPNAMFSVFDRRTQLMTALRLSDGFAPVVYGWQGSWVEVAITGDKPRFSPQAPAAFMPNGAVLYTGFENDGHVATWILENGQWRAHTGASPSRRKGAQMVFDSDRKVAVLYAGDDGNNVLNETWEWNGSAWKRIP